MKLHAYLSITWENFYVPTPSLSLVAGLILGGRTNEPDRVVFVARRAVNGAPYLIYLTKGALIV